MHLVYNKHRCYNRKDLGGESMFFKKTNTIIDLLNDHVNAVKTCYHIYMDNFDKIVIFQTNKEADRLLKLTEELKQKEHQADRIRHDVIVELLQGGFLVDSRKSTMRLVEGIDKVADTTEDIFKMIAYEQIQLDEELLKPLSQINKITHDQLNVFFDILSKLMTKYDQDEMIKQLIEIEEYESEVDEIEDKLMIDLFNKNITLAEKLQYKALIQSITSMSDLIEDLSDEVEIILASRKI